MICLDEVAVWLDISRTEVNEVSALSILASKFRDIVLSTCRERTAAEGKSVVWIIDSIEEPFDILVTGYDTRKTEELHRRVVRMDAHIHAPLIACWHDSSEEVTHILAQSIAVDILI